MLRTGLDDQTFADMSTAITSSLPATGAVSAATGGARLRLDSIDLLRGSIMVLMALDHVRDYFSGATFDPVDLTRTTPVFFFTRWITHFCAPVFIFLAGTSAFLYGSRGRTKRELSHFLWTRGLWLVVLEFTVVKWSWQFNFDYSQLGFAVIWVLGISMIIMAALVHLPLPWIGGIGVAMILGHNLLDSVSFPQSDWRFLPWTLLHAPNWVPISESFGFIVGYVIIPWVGVMAAGYALGPLFQTPPEFRQRWLLRLGAGMTAGFVLLRFLNVYGDPSRWSPQPSSTFTVLSFLNCTKYPPSLLYLLMTLGPALMLLAAFDHWQLRRPAWLIIFGRVPLFFYVLHLPLIHFAAGVTTFITDGAQHAQWIFANHFWGTRPEGYGYPLWGVYLAWIAILVLLYFPCRWFAEIKQRNRNPWLSYL